MNNGEDDKIRNANMKTQRQGEVGGGIYPTIRGGEGNESDFETQGETMISGNFGSYGGQGNLSEQRWGGDDEKVLGDAELGGDDVIMGGLVGVVSDDLLGIHEEQEGEEQAQMVKFIDERKEFAKRRKFLRRRRSWKK